MMTRIFILAILSFPAFAENARRIERVSMLNEGSTVDSIVWYQGESVTIDVFSKWGTARYAWPETASSVLRVWKADTPGTLYVDKTNAVYSAANGQTRNTLTPAQSNLGTNAYKFAVAVYDSTTFMGVAAEGDLEVRYAPQTGLPLVDGIASWPTELDDLSDVDAASPDAGQVLGYDGTNWVAVAAGSGSGDVTGITSTDSSITVTSGTGPVPNVALPATLPARNGSLLTALNASSLGSGTVPTARLGSGTANSGTFLRGDSTWAAPPFATTNAVRAAVADLYIPVDGDGRLGWSDPGVRPYMSIGYGVAPEDTTYPGVYFIANDGDTGGIRYLDSGTGFVQVKQGVADWSTVISHANLQTYGGGYFAPLSTVTNLNASALTSGTVPDARFPATFPAASGVNLTALNASNLASGTIPDAVTAAKYRQPVIAFSYRDLTWNTTAAAGWTGYEIESGASGSKRTFGLDAITSAVATDQTGTFKTDWIPVPANFLAFKTTGAIKVTWVSSQAVVGESELRGIRLIGSSDLTGANATDIYTDTTVRDITTTGVPVAVSINRSAFASTTVPAYICVQIDASVEDGDKLAIVSVEVLSE